MSAPLGWDNTTEMVATVVDALAHLTRMYTNANYENPNTGPVPLVPRPFQDAAPVKPQTISLAAFGDLLKET